MNVNVKELFSCEHFTLLNRYQLIDSVLYILNTPAFMSVDSTDLKEAFQDASFTGFINYTGDDFKDFKITKITDENPNKAILCITYNMNLTLKMVDEIIKKIYKEYGDMEIIYSTVINADINDFKIDAFFTKK